MSNNILSLKSQKGKLRNQQVGIFSDGKVEYMAVEPEFVKVEFAKLFFDIDELLNTDLSYKETFYYASMIHLMFEKIHIGYNYYTLKMDRCVPFLLMLPTALRSV